MAEKLMKYADATKKLMWSSVWKPHVELSHEHQAVLPGPHRVRWQANTELTPVSLGLPEACR